MKFKKKCQKRGIVILNALIAIVIVGLLGISLTSIYANMFSTLSAGRDASQAQQYAQIEGEYLKTQGYDNADSSVHDWKTMENLLGSDDGNLWESKVESVRDTETDDGNKLKIVKVSVRQKGDTTSRASYEVPLSSQGGSSGGNPDYSNAETISPNIEYTLKKDSYIYVYMFEVPTAYSQAHIIIDGNDFILGKSAGNYTFQNIKTSFLKVKKGSTIKVTGDSEIKIIPCI